MHVVHSIMSLYVAEILDYASGKYCFHDSRASLRLLLKNICCDSDLPTVMVGVAMKECSQNTECCQRVASTTTGPYRCCLRADSMARIH